MEDTPGDVEDIAPDPETLLERVVEVPGRLFADMLADISAVVELGEEDCMGLEI